MARQRASDWIPTYNNLARRKGVAQIPVNAKLTLDEVADKIEWVNNLTDIGAPKKKSKTTSQRITESDSMTLAVFKEIFMWCKNKSLQN